MSYKPWNPPKTEVRERWWRGMEWGEGNMAE